jgi:hypothetical protein
MAQAQQSRVSDAVELRSDRIVDFSLAMAVNIAPQRRDPIQIPSPIDVDQIVPVTLADDAELLRRPFLHLRKRVPEILVV